MNEIDIEQKVKELGVLIREVKDYGVSFKRYEKMGNIIYVSGHGPDWPPTEKYWNGKVGDTYSIEEGYEAAKYCGYNMLSTLKWALGDLNKVKQIVKVFGAVNATPDFTKHTDVVFGCSDLMQDVFGEKGRHARLAIGCASLPNNWPAEIEMIVEIEE